MTHVRTFLIVPGLALLALAQCSRVNADDPPRDAGFLGERHVYKSVDSRDLRLFVIKPDSWKATDKRPALVFFHGGGWTGGKPTQFDDQATYLASRGLVCVQVEYRLLDKNQDPPVICVNDAKSAMRWVRSHAAELGVDPNRIGAGGGSAGGHLSAFVGLVEGNDDPADDTSVSPKANALVLFNPVFDNGPQDGWGTARVKDRYQEFSPAHNISADDPPAIVFLGTEDKLIPVSVVERFRDNMRKAGVRCEAFFYEGQSHGFFNKDPHKTRTLREADRFLASLGWLKGPPTLPESDPSAAVDPADEARPPRPNIVLMMADDMGWSDLGCYGGEIDTPNLDGLAANGLRFTQFYNTARCCPTRAALLTGLYQHQAGIGHMTGNDGIPSYQGYLNDQCVTLGEVLRPAGYATLTTGKWHVGSAEGQWPLDRGFDRFWGTPSGGGVYFKDTLQIRTNVFFVSGQDRVEPPDDLYVTDTFTDHAISFVDEAVTQSKRPFFLYLAHIAPHWPLQAKPEDIEKYRGRFDAGWDAVREERYRRQVEMGLLPPGCRLSPRDPEAQPWVQVSAAEKKELAFRREVYAAQIDSIDQNVGRLVAKLKELGQFENTLFLFLSDNGCSAEGGPGGFSRGQEGAKIGTGLSYASGGLEWANASDTPFRKFKMDTHEGGIATPLIAHWPAGIEARGEVRHQPGHVIDIMPTLVEVTGAKYPAKRSGQVILRPEGASLVPAFRNRPIERDALYWEHEGNKAVRVGNWKAVTHGQQPWQLYDLSADRTEVNDLATTNPEQTRELAGLWQQWADRCGVQEWSDLQELRKSRPRRANR